MSLQLLRMKAQKDSEIKFPHILIVRASAGSGKTHALTERYVQFLLSDIVPKSDFKNMLAITFSNNAANEMRKRVLGTLKAFYFGEKSRMESLKNLLSISNEELKKRSGLLIDYILANYSDLQIRTIDSFMAKIFKAEAFNFDYPPEIQFVFSNSEDLAYALDVYLENLILSKEGQNFLDKLVSIIESTKVSYLWDPQKDIKEKIETIYSSFCTTPSAPLILEKLDHLFECEKSLADLALKIVRLAKESGLTFKKRSAIDTKFPEIVSSSDFTSFFSFAKKELPICVPKETDAKLKNAYRTLQNLWNEFQKLLSEYAYLYSISFYQPYMSVFDGLRDFLEKKRKKEGRLFIGDIGRKIAENLSSEIVPDVYFKLGETIYHFFIDEFQDTSPIQWFNLKPLIEESLSLGGSLFVVGDTKQAIYGFRGANLKIMRGLELGDEFPSCKDSKKVERLDVNWRSKKAILDFVENLFLRNGILKSRYQGALALTRLDEVQQKVVREGAGYVEIEKILSGDEKVLAQYFSSRINDILERGYALSDVAILAERNSYVTHIASIINGMGLPVISHSSIDIRFRKIIHEILTLLSFLFSPTDDFSFASFLLSETYSTFLAKNNLFFDPSEIFLEKKKRLDNEPLYKIFERKYPDFWANHFQDLLSSASYLPLYDLTTRIYKHFDLFNLFPFEEAAFLKFLEVARAFETERWGCIGDFVDFFLFSESEKGLFDISLPQNADAITLMTIHKAKGLGFPVVFVYLEEFSYLGRMDYVIRDERGYFAPLKIKKDLADLSERLQNLRMEKEESAYAELLNLLYVAFTRAQDELYVVCCSKKDAAFPFDFLTEEFGKRYGIKERNTAALRKKQNEITFTYEECLPVYEGIRSSFFGIGEKKRGELIHKLFASIEYAEEITLEDLRWKAYLFAYELGYSTDMEEITRLVTTSIKTDPIRSFFTKKLGRLVKNEFEVADHLGNVYRIDRIVIDPESVTILEYKTGEPIPEHRTQVEKYKRLISSVFKGRSVRAFIFYVDEMRVVSV